MSNVAHEVLENLPHLRTKFLKKYKKCITTSHFYGILCNKKCVFSIFWRKNLNISCLIL